MEIHHVKRILDFSIQVQLSSRVYVRVHKYVLGLTQYHFSPSRKARFTVNSEKGLKHIFAQKHRSCYYHYHFGG